MAKSLMRLLLILWLIGSVTAMGVVALAALLPPRDGAVFVAGMQGRRQLMQADLALGLSVRLPPADGDAFQPSVSPTTRELAFAAYSDGDSELWRLRPGDAAPQQLTQNSYDDRHPQWSPDGRRIAFQANPGGVFQLFEMDVASGVTRQLTRGELAAASPHWSPDGARLAYDAGGEIHIYDFENGKSHALTSDAHWDAHPVWSPAGDAIVYDSLRDGSWNLYRLDPATKDIKALTPPGRDEQHASFTRIEGQIVYQSVTRFTGSLFLLELNDPTRQRAHAIPPDIGAAMHLLFGHRAPLTPAWTDILEPAWLR